MYHSQPYFSNTRILKKLFTIKLSISNKRLFCNFNFTSERFFHLHFFISLLELCNRLNLNSHSSTLLNPLWAWATNSNTIVTKFSLKLITTYIIYLHTISITRQNSSRLIKNSNSKQKKRKKASVT